MFSGFCFHGTGFTSAPILVLLLYSLGWGSPTIFISLLKQPITSSFRLPALLLQEFEWQQEVLSANTSHFLVLGLKLNMEPG